MPETIVELIIRAKDETSATMSKISGGAKEFSSGLAGAVKSATGLDLASVGLAGAMGALGAGLKYAIDQAAEGERVMAQTQAVVKSTGMAAGLTANDIADMAGRLSDLNAVDDEAVQSGANVLLTFKSIGKDAFQPTMQAALDMSAALGTSLQGAIMQVGKALDNPVAGMAALRRSGVSFTEDQKALVKQLVATGHAADAQALILKELNSEFGGSGAAAANTYAGQMQKLKITLDNMAQAVGESLLPTLTEAAGALNLLLTWNQKVKQAVTDNAKSIANSAQTYDEYTASLKASAEAAGMSVDAEGRLVRAHITGMGATTEVVDANYAMSRSAFEAAHAANAQAAAFAAGEASLSRFIPAAQGSGKSLEQVWKDMQDAADASAEAQKQRLDELTGYYKTVFGSDLGQSVEDFKTSQSDLRDEIGQTAQKVADLEGLSYLTPAQQTELETLKGKLGDLRTEYQKEADAHRKKTAQIIFDLIVQKATVDGVITDAENGFITRMGTALGIFDSTMAGVLTDSNTAWGEFNSGNVAAAEERLLNIQRTLNGMPTSADWTLNIHVNGSIPSAAAGDAGLAIGDSSNQFSGGTTTTDTQVGNKFATGGDFIVPAGYPNDSYPMRVSTGERVTVTPPGQDGPGGGGVYVAPGAISITAAPGMNTQDLARAMVVELGRQARTAQLAGAAYMGR